MFLLDKAELNPLLLGVRFTTDMIERAMVNMVDSFNLMNPPTNIHYTVENFPFRSVLLLGTSAYLLRSAAINEANNELSYSANGVTVNDKDKAQTFLGISGQLMGEFKEMAQNLKLNQNISQVYGVKFSEYQRRVF